MTHPRATRLRALAMTLPIEAIVLETDAPDIPPEWLGRARNEPAELARIATVLAELRGISVDEIAEQTAHNTLAVLPRLAESAL
jgi:TatD DNase family protein